LLTFLSSETGHESGGNVFNLPLPHCTTAATYRQEFEKVVRKLDAFAPQFLFLSSGYSSIFIHARTCTTAHAHI
jgi:acetoin utilization deacetylase AcuC-like enzyme